MPKRSPGAANCSDQARSPTQTHEPLAIKPDALPRSLSRLTSNTADQGWSKPTMVDLLGALSNRSRQVRRLLEHVQTWPTTTTQRRRARPRPVRTARQLSPEEVTQLVADYQAGALVKDLAIKFALSRDTVCQHLNRQQVPRRQQGMRPEDIPTAVKLYQQGWSLARLAERFGTTDMTVRARLLEKGVQMRGPHDRPTP